MYDIFYPIIAAILASILSPLFLSFLQHKFIWRAQKTSEMRAKVFDEAVTALAMLEADGIVPKQTPQGDPLPGGFRAETLDGTQKALSLVEAFFSAPTFEFVKAAFSADMSKIPNKEFSEQRTRALRAMASELGLQLD